MGGARLWAPSQFVLSIDNRDRPFQRKTIDQSIVFTDLLGHEVEECSILVKLRSQEELLILKLLETISARAKKTLPRLLLSQVANYGQLIHLTLIRFEQNNNPNNQCSQSNEHVQRRSQENE